MCLRVFLDGLFNRLLHSIHGLGHGPRDFHLLGDFLVEIVDAGHVGEKVERQFRIVAQEACDIHRGTGIEQQRVLAQTGWDWE